VSAEDSFGGYAQTGELQKLVMESPEDADAWYALGRSYEISLRTERAREAYGKALGLFLKQRRVHDAARAYAGVIEYGLPGGLTPDQKFDLACALEEAGQAGQAYGLFREVAVEHPSGERAETALMRAAEIARASLRDAARASECYRRLLEHYPYSTWRALAQERLREVSGPQEPGPSQSPPLPGRPADSDRESLA
jgi:tetratricopeptide (TPR) repeat protein